LKYHTEERETEEKRDRRGKEKTTVAQGTLK
jgi:hypothetical protein